jgi:hypothetical protein
MDRTTTPALYTPEGDALLVAYRAAGQSVDDAWYALWRAQHWNANYSDKVDTLPLVAALNDAIAAFRGHTALVDGMLSGPVVAK